MAQTKYSLIGGYQTGSHYGLVIPPLMVITLLCFGLVMLQKPTRMMPVAADAAKHVATHNQAQVNLPLAATNELPHLSIAPVAEGPATQPASMPTASLQTGVPLPANLQSATNLSQPVTQHHHSSHKSNR